MPLAVLVESHVRQRREERGWSLTALAEAADLKKSYLANAETGLTDFRVSQIQRLAQILDCHPCDLITFPGFAWPRPCQPAPPAPEGVTPS